MALIHPLAAETIRALFDGIDAGKFEYAGDRYNVRVSLKDDQRKSLDNLDGLYINSSKDPTTSKLVPLANITKKVLSTSYASIFRYDRLRQVELSANVEGIAFGDFLTKVYKISLNELDIPKGVFVQQGGMNETMSGRLRNLVIALLMGILFMFLVMTMQFESFLDPIAIMFSLPMALNRCSLGTVYRRE